MVGLAFDSAFYEDDCEDVAASFLFNAQPGQTNAETRASTTTTAAATTAAISLPWEEEVCVLDIRLILSQP